MPNVSDPAFSVASEPLSHFSLPEAVDAFSDFSSAGAQPAAMATETQTTLVINHFPMGRIIAQERSMRQR